MLTECDATVFTLLVAVGLFSKDWCCCWPWDDESWLMLVLLLLLLLLLLLVVVSTPVTSDAEMYGTEVRLLPFNELWMSVMLSRLSVRRHCLIETYYKPTFILPHRRHQYLLHFEDSFVSSRLISLTSSPFDLFCLGRPLSWLWSCFYLDLRFSFERFSYSAVCYLSSISSADFETIF